MLEQINIMKLKCMDQRFGLGYKLKKEDYKGVAQIRREAWMVKINGSEPKVEDIVM